MSVKTFRKRKERIRARRLHRRLLGDFAPCPDCGAPFGLYITSVQDGEPFILYRPHTKWEGGWVGCPGAKKPFAV